MARGRGPRKCRRCGFYGCECRPMVASTSGGTYNSTAFADRSQRDDPTITNTYFNAGAQDGADHGHVKYHNNPDGTTDYLYARDVEGNEYDV